MEPIVVMSIIGLAAFLVVSATVEQIWERKYVREHYTFEKDNVLVLRKYALPVMDDKKKFVYFIDAEEDGKKVSYSCSKSLYDEFVDGKTYSLKVVRQKVVEIKN